LLRPTTKYKLGRASLISQLKLEQVSSFKFCLFYIRSKLLFRIIVILIVVYKYIYKLLFFSGKLIELLTQIMLETRNLYCGSFKQCNDEYYKRNTPSAAFSRRPHPFSGPMVAAARAAAVIAINCCCRRPEEKKRTFSAAFLYIAQSLDSRSTFVTLYLQ
jgi:hypothetical protein